jgi:oxygen-independent coproporphyrinogen-3 oxidase
LNWPETQIGSAYIHVPFCVRKCTYCDFVSVPSADADQQRCFLAAVKREIIHVAGLGLPSGGPPGRLQTVFIGGGTPTVLSAAALAGILEQLDCAFGLAADGEYTLEANPGTVTAAGLLELRRAGFNRISFGLQAAQAPLLRLLGRIHDTADFVRSVAAADAAGFSHINADILFGLPGQTLADLDETLDLLLGLPLDHISAYALTLAAGTPLFAQCRQQPGLLPDDETERAQYRHIRRRLTANGLCHDEISNFARPGCHCRHNHVYWQGLPYWGFGPAAHSFVAGRRRANTAVLADYLAAWSGAVGAAWPKNTVLETIDYAAAQVEMIILGLRLIAGVREDAFRQRFGISLNDRFAEPIRKNVARGWLVQDAIGIRLSESGLDLANQVELDFL